MRNIAGIDDLREKREEILKQLREDDSEKAKITQELQILTRRLSQVNESLARKVRFAALSCIAAARSTLLFVQLLCHAQCDIDV